MVIGSSWVQLERVNPRPSPTYSARESEWAKAKAMLNCCNSVFERNRVDLGKYECKRQQWQPSRPSRRHRNLNDVNEHHTNDPHHMGDGSVESVRKVQVGEHQVHSANHRRGQRPRLKPPSDSRHFYIRVCKLGEPRKLLANYRPCRQSRLRPSFGSTQ
uniref:Uncharacterized protein n=1 Tax=Solanum tuberosum TaxID=4113 RepID=M1DUJ3_SOLTU